MRVFELARDLGMTSRELLDGLGKMGIAVEDHSSRLEGEELNKVIRKFGKKPPAKKKKAAAKPKQKVAPPVEEAPEKPKTRMMIKRRRAKVPEEAAPTVTAEQEPTPAVETAQLPPVPEPVVAAEPTPEPTPEPVTEQPELVTEPVTAKAAPEAEPTPQPIAAKPQAEAPKPRIVIDLDAPKKAAAAKKAAAKAKAEAQASQDAADQAAAVAEANAAAAAKKSAPPLPSAADRVRTLTTGGLATPDGLTPHLTHVPREQKERVVIALPKATPDKPAKTEKKDRKKGRPDSAQPSTAPAKSPAGPGKGAALDPRKRKWQSFKGGKKGKGRHREDMASFSRRRKEAGAQEGSRPRVKAIRITEGATVKEFADSMGIKVNIIIGELMKMGTMATLNDPIDIDAANLIAETMEVKMEVVMEKTEDELLEVIEDAPETLKPRAPVVTIMGHVDHGKTSLLDALRNSRVAAKEAGGITQHIGAYSVETERGKIIFLDTPGHAAFTAMRARGANYTDIVVLVVAADDSVMPQTIEAISHAKNAGVPIIVAITKMDKEGADASKVQQALTEYELISEDWGGETQFAMISAHTGEGLPNLLEKIALQSEIMELTANPDKSANGVVVEARLDRGRGPVATLLVQSGTLKVGDFFVTGNHTGRVRAMTDDLGNRLTEAGPAMPIEIIGLEGVPMAGDSFNAVINEKAAKEVANTRRIQERSRALAREKKLSLDDLFAKMGEEETLELPVVLRGDVQGSLEAIQDGLVKLSTDKVRVKILHTGVGGITETDVMLASASNAIILGFSVRPEPKAAKLAESEGVDVRLYNIIYNLMDEVKSAMEGLLAPLYKERSLGRAEVREVFQIPKVGLVAGCYVTEGTILRNCSGLRVVRDNVVVHEGSLNALRRFKDDVKEVAKGFECGISFERFNDIKAGDYIEAFTLDEVAATL